MNSPQLAGDAAAEGVGGALLAEQAGGLGHGDLDGQDPLADPLPNGCLGPLDGGAADHRGQPGVKKALRPPGGAGEHGRGGPVDGPGPGGLEAAIAGPGEGGRDMGDQGVGGGHNVGRQLALWVMAAGGFTSRGLRHVALGPPGQAAEVDGAGEVGFRVDGRARRGHTCIRRGPR